MSGKKKDISFESFVKAVTFLKENNENQVGLIGGEPTQHPDLIAMLDYIIEQKMTIQLFTNGLIERALSSQLEKYSPKNIYMLVNLNEKHTYDKSQLEKIDFFLEKCNDKIGLGYTIHHHSFDLSFHKEKILRYNLKKQLRLGLAAPIGGRKSNDFLQEDIHDILAKNIISNINEVEKDDILINLDCGFFMCLFTKEQLGIITLKTLGFKSKCGPVLDIDTELNVHHCFSATDYHKQHISKFPDFSSLKNYFQNLNDQLKFTAREGKCLMCKYFTRGQCCGWCLGRIINT